MENDPAKCVKCDYQINISGHTICDNCAARLHAAIKEIIPTLKWLKQISGWESTRTISQFDQEGQQSRLGRTTNIAPATYVADQLRGVCAFWINQTVSNAKYHDPGTLMARLFYAFCRKTWAAQLLDDLRAELAEIHKEYPRPGSKANPHPLGLVPCRACEQNDLWLYPQSVVGQEIVIRCDCGWVCPEDAQEWMMRLAVHEKERQKQMAAESRWVLAA